jgi:hypothetical protein
VSSTPLPTAFYLLHGDIMKYLTLDKSLLVSSHVSFTMRCPLSPLCDKRHLWTLTTHQTRCTIARAKRCQSSVCRYIQSHPVIVFVHYERSIGKVRNRCHWPIQGKVMHSSLLIKVSFTYIETASSYPQGLLTPRTSTLGKAWYGNKSTRPNIQIWLRVE